MIRRLDSITDSMGCSTRGLPVPHYLPEFAQVHVHCIGDTIQPSHPLSPFSPASNLSTHSGSFPMSWLFPIRWPKYWSFSFSISPSKEYSGLISFRIDGLISFQSKGLSRVFSNTSVQKHQFFSTRPSLWSNSHIHI